MELRLLWARGRTQWRLMALLLVAVIVVVILTALVYQSEVEALRTAEGINLESIAALKANQLAQLRKGGLGDATLLSGRPFFNANLAVWLAEPTPEIADELRESLAAANTGGVYTNIALFDGKGQERLRLYPDRPLARCAPTYELLAGALASGMAQISDLYRCAQGEPARLDVAAPLLLVQNGTTTPIGTILLAVDVPNVLAPLIDQWPIPSASGETLLAERQGDTVANLNDFIVLGSPPLSVRYPITAATLPLVQAVLKEEGSGRGIDQEGREALAGYAAVPGTAWRIAAQMDMAEIDAPLVSRFGWYVAAAAGVVGLGAAMAALLLLAYQQRTLRRLYEEVRQELTVSEEEYHTLFNSSPVGLNVSRLEDGCFVDVNQAFVDLVGYSRAELIGRTSLEIGLFSPATRAGALDRMQNAKLETIEIDMRRKTGEVRDCLIAADVLDLPSGRFLLISSMDITERKQAEQAQAFLSGIVTYSSDAIVGRDMDGRIVSWNASAERMFGYTAAEAIGQPAALIVPPHRMDELVQNTDRVAQAPALDVFETERMAKDGSLIDVALSVFQVRDGSGTLTGVGVILHDIRARKRAEAALRESQEKLQSLFDVLPVGVSIVDADNHALDANPVLAQILDMTDEGIQRGAYAHRRYLRADGSLMPPEEFPSLRAVREQRAIRSVEIGIEKEDGAVIWTSVSATPLSPTGLSATVTVDITERKQAEDALRQSEARLKGIIENTVNRIWSVDRAYRLVVANPAFVRGTTAPLGRPLPLGESVLQPSFPHDVNVFWQAQYDRALGGESFVFEMAARFADEDATLECHMNPIRDTDGAVIGAAGLTVDVTKQKLAARILQNTNAELERRVDARTAELQETVAALHRANAGKDAFMAVVSHELRTPLTGILAMSEVLQSQGRDPLTPRQSRYVAMIRASGDRLLETINSVLLYTSLVGDKYTVHHTELRLLDLCAENVAALGAKASAKGQHIELTVEPKDLLICTDAAAMARILQILLDNAIKFTPEGGTLGIQAHRSLAGNTAAETGTASATPSTADLGTICVTVWDTGIGIDPAQQAHLFAPFTQVDQSLARRFEGVGVGLASVQKLVDLLGGSVAVQSAHGQGARFTVTLPVTPA